MHEIKDIVIIIHTCKRRIFMAQGQKVMLDLTSSNTSLFWWLQKPPAPSEGG